MEAWSSPSQKNRNHEEDVNSQYISSLLFHSTEYIYTHFPEFIKGYREYKSISDDSPCSYKWVNLEITWYFEIFKKQMT